MRPRRIRRGSRAAAMLTPTSATRMSRFNEAPANSPGIARRIGLAVERAERLRFNEAPANSPGIAAIELCLDGLVLELQ